MLNIFLTLFGLLAVVQCGPLHASCKVTWTINMKCGDVETALVDQIKKWDGFTTCGQGEKCGYKLVSQSATELKATHTTPVKHYVDDLTFDFKQSGAECQIKGYSTSETWYAVLDYGTNYCNMRNLMEGAKLVDAPGFKETTSNSVCTQFSSHNCEKY